MILQMSKVEIIGRRSLYYDVLKAVHQLGILHIEDISKLISPGELVLKKMEADEKTEEEKKKLEETIVRINSILSSLLPEEAETIKKVEQTEYTDLWDKEIDELVDKVDTLVEELEKKPENWQAKKASSTPGFP